MAHEAITILHVDMDASTVSIEQRVLATRPSIAPALTTPNTCKGFCIVVSLEDNMDRVMILLGMLVGSALALPSNPLPKPIASGLANPASVAVGSDGRIYISEIGASGKDGDGRVLVVDKSGKITYAEYVPEVTSHPNYDKAVEALKAVAG